MKKLFLLLALSFGAMLCSCDNDEPAQDDKEIVAYFDADGKPHLFDEEQYTTQQLIDKLKNKIPLIAHKTIYLLDNNGRVSEVRDKWKKHCEISNRPYDELDHTAMYDQHYIMLDNNVIKILPCARYYFNFSDYPYDKASEDKFMDRVFENSRPVKILEHYMFETGVLTDGTPYYAKVYFGSEKLFDEVIQTYTLHPNQLYDPAL